MRCSRALKRTTRLFVNIWWASVLVGIDSVNLLLVCVCACVCKVNTNIRVVQYPDVQSTATNESRALSAELEVARGEKVTEMVSRVCRCAPAFPLICGAMLRCRHRFRRHFRNWALRMPGSSTSWCVQPCGCGVLCEARNSSAAAASSQTECDKATAR
jgi:hypothetical protein